MFYPVLSSTACVSVLAHIFGSERGGVAEGGSTGYKRSLNQCEQVKKSFWIKRRELSSWQRV